MAVCLLFLKEEKVKISTCNPSTCEEREFEATLGFAAKPASTTPSTKTPSSKEGFGPQSRSLCLTKWKSSPPCDIYTESRSGWCLLGTVKSKPATPWTPWRCTQGGASSGPLCLRILYSPCRYVLKPNTQNPKKRPGHCALIIGEG